MRDSHLPQGAPTSPALSNLAAFALDRRLAGLARSRGAAYTRYADDMVFSGDADFARRVMKSGRHQNRAGYRDFRAYLAGRISWVASSNPRRGARLQSLFEQIEWSPIG